MYSYARAGQVLLCIVIFLYGILQIRVPQASLVVSRLAHYYNTVTRCGAYSRVASAPALFCQACTPRTHSSFHHLLSSTHLPFSLYFVVIAELSVETCLTIHQQVHHIRMARTTPKPRPIIRDNQVHTPHTNIPPQDMAGLGRTQHIATIRLNSSMHRQLQLRRVRQQQPTLRRRQRLQH